MKPPIHHCTTTDNVTIAYWIAGEGRPLVWLPPMHGHIELEAQLNVFALDYGSLASAYRLIRLDFRGSGMSQHVGGGTNFDLDINAVLDDLAIERTALVGVGPAGMLSVMYAHAHPHRLTHLVLSETMPSFDAVGEDSRFTALLRLLEMNYEMYTETLASLFFGWSANDAREYAQILRASQTREEAVETMAKILRIDVTPLLPEVTVPTLVIHRRDATLVPTSIARIVADRIPGARFALLDGGQGERTAPDEAEVLDGFLLSHSTGRRTRASQALPDTEVILFTDIVGSTRLTEAMGDAAFRKRATTLDGVLRENIRAGGGTPVEGKLLGDGVLATFPSAASAIQTAARCTRLGEENGLALHIGIHAGDVIREHDNIFGGAVNIAARIADAAQPGDVVVSDVVRTLGRTSAGVGFEDLGEHQLKGVAEPQRLWRVVQP